VIVFPNSTLRLFLAPAALAGVLAACGGDETQPTEDHIPDRYNVLINGEEVSPPFTFVSGETARVQIKFFNRAGEDLDEIESSHFGGLTFNPTSLATATRVGGHNYQFDVAAGAEGAGTVVVRFGHDDAADDKSFPAAPVTVTGQAPQ
jgi:hypothetical protein